MKNKELTITAVVLGVLAILFAGLYFTSSCSSSEYEGGVQLLEERTVTSSLVNYTLFNEILSSYDVCPEEGCKIINNNFISLSIEGLSEEEKILLLSKITDDLYESIPLTYDIPLKFIFKDASGDILDKIEVKSDRWNRPLI